MALVVLPCDLPHWHSLQKQLTLLSTADNANQLTSGMLRIHAMCNTGLDPDEPEKTDPEMFTQLEVFLNSMSTREHQHFFTKTLPCITKRALDIKIHKPVNGFHFSLQQQSDEMFYKRPYLASLLAHAFFSTFPKRTSKTHPTLQDFNFTYFFHHLDEPYQQNKLRSFFRYFDILQDYNEDDMVTFSRQVMPGKQWLTIEDWLDSTHPLCPVVVRHDGRLHSTDQQCLRVCFVSQKLGGPVLLDGSSQECIEFFTVPELLCVLASVEALEDNECILVKDALQVTTISDPRQSAILNLLNKPVKVNLCCIDAENYTRLPLSQLEEDNVLRELNKALLGFKQGRAWHRPCVRPLGTKIMIQRRLSPIGESFSSTPPEHKEDESPPPTPSKLDSPARRAAWLRPPSPPLRQQVDAQARRGRFIVLGSSGECLPVSRVQTFLAGKREILLSTEIPPADVPERRPSNRDSLYSSAQSDDEEAEEEEVFHSARTSVDFDKDDPYKVCDWANKNDDVFHKQDSVTFDEDRRYSFAERLREALLRGATTYSSASDDSSYAVGISVTGSSTADQENIRCKRGTSIGFLLPTDSLDDGFYQDSVDHEPGAEYNRSDRYSFTSDSSDLGDMYEQFNQWLTHNNKESGTELQRDAAVSEIATALLKRAFSDSYAIAGDSSQNKMALAARSFSLELAKQNPRLAAQLVSLLSDREAAIQLLLPNKEGLHAVATGNWGCGSTHGGDAQIKLAVQWLAASYAGLPSLVYYTCRHHKLLKLDTLRRILIDRGWTVGQLTTALLGHSQSSLQDPQSTNTFFDVLMRT